MGGGGGQHHTPARLSIQYTRGWVSVRAGLDGCEEDKIPCIHRGSKPGPSNQQ